MHILFSCNIKNGVSGFFIERFYRGIIMIEKVKRFLFSPEDRFGYLRVMGAYNHLSDKDFLRKEFKLFLGEELNLDNPKTFNEKIQWLKIYDRKPKYTLMVDKIEAKKYVAGVIGERHIIPTIGVYDSFEQIDFNMLPNQFVLKCNHDSGGLAICRDKKIFDIELAKKKINKALKRKYFMVHREWPYKDVIPKVFAEKYMSDGHKGLRDYKFFCFNGEPQFIYISEGLEDHQTAQISFFDLDGKQLPFKRKDFRPFDCKDIDLPDNFSEMLNLSRTLSKDIEAAFVRIDFYSINNETFFSEITFSPCAGMIPFEPKNWDSKLGEMLEIRSCEK